MLTLLGHVRPLAVGFFAMGVALGAQAAPAMFEASFIFQAWGNDASSGTTSPTYTSNFWVAAPLGYDCQNAEKYSGNVLNTRYCSWPIHKRGHPATGMGNGTTTSRLSVVPGTPVPGIVLQQSALGVLLITDTDKNAPPYPGWPWKGTTPTYSSNCCRGFLLTFPPYIQSFTYATWVNAAGSFFAGGGAVAAGYTGRIGGTGTTAYNNHTAVGNLQGSWRIRAGQNQFGGALGMLGKYGAKGKWSIAGDPTFYEGTSSWAMVPDVGRLYKATVLGTNNGKATAWQNPWSKTAKWYKYYTNGDPIPGKTSTLTAIGVGTLWTTGQVNVRALVGAYPTSHWRTGYDNRTAYGNGRIQLVTPTLTHWLSTGLNTHSGQMALLILQVPEPGAVLLLAMGGGVLGLLYWMGRRV